MIEQVVCLVRGGEAGRFTQEQAIDYARQTGRKIVFLHIITPGGFQLENEDLLEPVLKEQTWLARVNLGQARQRAERRGMKGETAIRMGPFVETVLTYVQEQPVDRVYLGKPRQDTEDYEQRLARINAFIKRLADEGSVEAVVV